MRYPLKCCIIKKEEKLIMSQQKTHHTKQFKLDTINYRKEPLIILRLNAQRAWVSVSVSLLTGNPCSEIMTRIFPLSILAVTLLKKSRKLLVLSVNSVMHGMHLFQNYIILLNDHYLYLQVSYTKYLYHYHLYTPYF